MVSESDWGGYTVSELGAPPRRECHAGDDRREGGVRAGDAARASSLLRRLASRLETRGEPRAGPEDLCM